MRKEVDLFEKGMVQETTDRIVNNLRQKVEEGSEGVLELAEQITIIRRSNDLKERLLKTAMAELRMKVVQSESLKMTSEVSCLFETLLNHSTYVSESQTYCERGPKQRNTR